ncbi:MAG: c-type cytochrome [Magnetococcales bacterium]|nr:c-type cytochrome [Magnetococcales bacterium]
MKIGHALSLIMLLLLILLAGMAYKRSLGDTEMGKLLAENNCGVCHDLTSAQKRDKGPYLWEIHNRPAGVVDFPFSPAFRKLVEETPFVWDDAQLDRWLTNPASFIPQTRMAQHSKEHPISFDGIKSAGNRKDLIAYLKTLR